MQAPGASTKERAASGRLRKCLAKAEPAKAKPAEARIARPCEGLIWLASCLPLQLSKVKM